MSTKKYVSLDKLSLYDEKIKKVVTDADAATLASAKQYFEDNADRFDVSGAAATAEANAKAYADGKDAAIQAAQKAADDAAAAAATADGKAVAAQGEVDALESYVGTFTHETAKTVVEYINAKTDGIATSGNLEALGSRVTAVEGDVATIKGDYLKSADKTELAGDIADVQTAVDTEKSRAEGKEAELAASIKAISDDYLKATDKEELQGNIDTVAGAVERLTNGVSADEVDGVNDLIAYVKEHGAEVTGMQEDIADNAEAIEAVVGRMDTAEGKITAVEGAVATKAEKTYVDEKVEALQGVDATQNEKIAALEAKFADGDGSVADMIDDAKAEAIATAAQDAANKDAVVLAESQKYTDAEIDKVEASIATLTEASATHALKSEVEAVAGDVETLKTDMAQAKADIDTVEALAAANKAAHEANAAAIALKASQADLEAVSGRVTTLETWHNNFTEVSEEEINAMFA